MRGDTMRKVDDVWRCTDCGMPVAADSGIHDCPDDAISLRRKLDAVEVWFAVEGQKPLFDLIISDEPEEAAHA